MARGKTSSDNLYQLIKSLSRTEKRYFKLFVSRYSTGQKSVNERLFNAIATQSDYNEQELLERFSDEDFVSSFSVAKTRLYNSIIESLQFFHSGKTSENKLYKYLNEIEILYQKSLYGQCSKILKKAEKLAHQEEMIEIRLMLTKWKLKLAESMKYLSKFSEGLDEELLKVDLSADALKQEFFLLQKKTEFFKALYAGRVNASNEEIKTLITSLGNARDYNSSRSRLILYQIKSAWYFALNQLKKSNHYSIKALACLKGNELERKISILGNIIYTAIAIEDFEIAEEYLRQLKDFQNRNDSGLSELQRISLFENIASLDLYFYLQSGDIDLAYDSMHYISNELSKYNGQISALNRASFYFNFAQICIIKGEFKSALGWINQLLNHPKIDDNEKIFSHGVMLSLIIHYELKNYGYIQSKLKSVERYLSKRNRLLEFESKFLYYMKALSRDELNDRSKLLVRWKKDLKSKSIRQQSDSFLMSFNLFTWIDSQIEKALLIGISN